MPEFKPEIGLVIRHAYLWRSEARKGRVEGFKDRPGVIVHVRRNEYQEIETFIAPVTHTPPKVHERAIEIPQMTKKRLGLDTEQSWVMTTEVNRFIWPGPDIRTVPGGGLSYGSLPAAMTHDLVQQIKTNARDRSLLVIDREDGVLNEKRREMIVASKTQGQPVEELMAKVQKKALSAFLQLKQQTAPGASRAERNRSHHPEPSRKRPDDDNAL